MIKFKSGSFDDISCSFDLFYKNIEVIKELKNKIIESNIETNIETFLNNNIILFYIKTKNFDD